LTNKKQKDKIMTDSRTSRANESRAAGENEDIRDEFDDIDFTPANLSTKDIPPREGYVQRWVRTKKGDEDDPSNVYKSSNVGWKPRLADSVKSGVILPTIAFNGDNVIGLHDTILMERPEALHNKHENYHKQMAKDQLSSVYNDLHKVHDRSSGMGAPQDNSTSRVSRGRQAAITPD